MLSALADLFRHSKTAAYSMIAQLSISWIIMLIFDTCKKVVGPVLKQALIRNDLHRSHSKKIALWL